MGDFIVWLYNFYQYTSLVSNILRGGPQVYQS